MCDFIDILSSSFICNFADQDQDPASHTSDYISEQQREIKFSLFHKYLVEKLHGIMSVRSTPKPFRRETPNASMRADEHSRIEIETSQNEENCNVFQADFETFRLSNSAYSLCTTVKIDKDNCSVEVRSTVLKGGRLLQVKSPAIRLLLCRYLNRLNGALIDGSIAINPHNGALIYRLFHIFTIGQFDMIMHDIKDGPDLIEGYVVAVHGGFNYNIYKIIYLMDEISLEEMKKLAQKGDLVRQVCPAAKEKADFIEHAIDISLYDFNFMFDWRLSRDISQTIANRICQISRKQLEKSQRISLKDKQKIDNISQRLLSYNETALSSHTNYDKEKDYLRKYHERLVGLLLSVKVKWTQYFQKAGVLSLIHIYPHHSTKWRAKSSGGFSQIDMADCLFAFLNERGFNIPSLESDKKFIFRRVLARKVQKQLHEGKIQHEKLILNQIRNQMSASVCRFYESDQPQYKNNLFMIYCQYSDYSSFKRTRKTVMSLLMRLYFLSQLVEGLRFLHTKNVYHLDLKPQNLLIGKAFILKITDFGEAYHPNVCPQGT